MDPITVDCLFYSAPLRIKHHIWGPAQHIASQQLPSNPCTFITTPGSRKYSMSLSREHSHEVNRLVHIMDVTVFYAGHHKPYHNSPPLSELETGSKHHKKVHGDHRQSFYHYIRILILNICNVKAVFWQKVIKTLIFLNLTNLQDCFIYSIVMFGDLQRPPL
jgi:hypothetical protein